MRGDRRPVSPTELAQLSRCEQQLLFDRKYGAKRSRRWQQRAGEGNAVHADLHRRVTTPGEDPARWKIWLIVGAVTLAFFVLWVLENG